jgi:hypothetical protein
VQYFVVDHAREKPMPDKIETIVALPGIWSAGGRETIRIMVYGNELDVSMRAFQRPSAQGVIQNASTISVTFPDDRTYTGTLQPPDLIRWSNGTVWRWLRMIEE